jgi:hypothetical protein
LHTGYEVLSSNHFSFLAGRDLREMLRGNPEINLISRLERLVSPSGTFATFVLSLPTPASPGAKIEVSITHPLCGRKSKKT